MTRYMASRKKNDKGADALEKYLRFLRLCKLLLTDTGYEFDLRSIRPDNEFRGLMMKWLEIEKCDLIKIGSRQADTVMMDMLFDAWNDINVGGKIDVNIKVHERGKDS